jgi:hypothetical protein
VVVNAFVNTGDNDHSVKIVVEPVYVNTGENDQSAKNVVEPVYVNTVNGEQTVKNASVKSNSKGGSCVKANGAIRTETQSTKDIVGCVLCGHSRTNL